MDLESALHEAREAAAAEDPLAADQFVHAVMLRDLEPLDLVRIGLTLRDAGKPGSAALLLRAIASRWPSCVAAHYESAFLHRLAGEHLDAVRDLQRAAREDPDDLRVAKFLTHMLYAIGADQEAEASYRSTVPRAGLDAELEAIREFGGYLREWSFGSAILLLERLQRAHGWLDSAQIAERVIAALESRTPFALIRLGDGEGSCIALGNEDERRFPTLYAKNRHELTAMWFGPKFPADATGFTALARAVLDTALKCDVVGVPYEGWIAHEYRISSTRGVPSLVNILRGLDAIQPRNSGRPALCSQSIHLDLQNTGALQRILGSVRRLSLISCLTELPDLLRRHFDLEEVVLYRIPGEQGSSSILGRDAVAGTHFPTEYMRIQEVLRRPHEGRLFLIAAGILGKFYALTVRQFGGVALDIGSVADGWARKATRPGMATDSLALA